MEKVRNEVTIRNNSNWKDVRKREIKSFLRLFILVVINDLPNVKLYWCKNMVFHSSFVSSIKSKYDFLQIFYNIHLTNNLFAPKLDDKN